MEELEKKVNVRRYQKNKARERIGSCKGKYVLRI